MRLGYDADGNETSVTDADGHTTTSSFDAFGDKIATTDPGGRVTSYAVDAAGRLVSSTDPRGAILTTAYDAAGQVTGGATGSRTYDAAGELTSLVDGTGTTTYSYDMAGRITQVAAPNGTIGYSYDIDGRRIQMTLPGPNPITYTYDGAGNLKSEAGLGQTVAFTYDTDGGVATVARSNGTTTTYGYDGNQYINSVVTTNGATTLGSFAYRRDADGNPTSLTTPAGVTSYAYDKLDRLLSATGPAATSFAYAYDAAGNLTSSTVGGLTTLMSYDTSGRLTLAGSNAVTEDGAGNVTSIGSDTFAWDTRDELTSSTVGGRAATYAYDGNGLRAATTGPVTANLWDEVDPQTGQLAALPQLASDGTDTFLSGNGQVLNQVAAGAGTWYVPDALGSTEATTGPAGTVTGTTTYTPYGGTASTSGTQAAFGFTGEVQDPTGLVYLRARYLDPAVGQLLSADAVQPNALGTPGYNRYAYAADDPVRLTDPSGRDDVAEETVAQLLPGEVRAVALRSGGNYYRELLGRQLILNNPQILLNARIFSIGTRLQLIGRTATIFGGVIFKLGTFINEIPQLGYIP